MKDTITCPECGGNMQKPATQIEDAYVCDCCGAKMIDGVLEKQGIEPNEKEETKAV